MKKRVLPLILTVALLMSFALTACGENNGASPDSSATADESATGDSRTATSAISASSSDDPSSDASSAEDPASSPEDSSGGSSQEVSSSAAAAPQQEDAAGNDTAENEESDQKVDPAPAENEKSSTSKQASSQSASSVAHNPAYGEDDRPNFKIVLTRKSDKKEYSAACNYAKADEDLAYVSFFLPGGEYDIAVYEYADQIDKDHPLATSTYNNKIDEKKKKSIRVNYTADNKKIEVKENTSSQPKK